MLHPRGPLKPGTPGNYAAAELPKEALLRVVLPTALTLLVCNMDRICLSIAILPMSQEFGWSASLQVCRAACPNNDDRAAGRHAWDVYTVVQLPGAG